MSVRYRRAVDLVELTGILQTTATGLSIDEIAERFEVSRRTAERMLNALRERFGDLQPVHRDGRKYWRLSPDGRRGPLQLPRTLEALTRRVEALEAEVRRSRETEQRTRLGQALFESVLATSDVGMFVLDADWRVVWLNEAITVYLDLDTGAVVGNDMRRLLREQIRHRIERPDDFAERLLETYANGTYIGLLECDVLGDEGRAARRLVHGSRPIPSGPYRGGRVDRYVDVTARTGGVPAH